MVIAVLALLGVDLVVILVLLGFLLSRKRWVTAGEFKRLGDNPSVVRLKVGRAAVEVVTKAEDSEPMLGPFP